MVKFFNVQSCLVNDHYMTKKNFQFFDTSKKN